MRRCGRRRAGTGGAGDHVRQVEGGHPLNSKAAARIVLVLGTRPDALKLAPIVRALRDSPAYEPLVVATGQHREMLDQVFQVFDIHPHTDLEILRERQTLTGVTSRVLKGLEPVLADLQPRAVVVQGDTTTTFAGALAAFYAQVPVVHVEAGLRTHDRWSPYPEEMNRRLVSPLASLHLAPTAKARSNLLAEGVPAQTVSVTGNTSIDALLWAVQQPVPAHPLLDALAADPRRLVLVTLHRRESWGEPLRQVAHALARLTELEPDVVVVVALHRNPVVREALVPILSGRSAVLLVEPPDYAVFVHLMSRAHVILTDSGGIQEEGPSLGKPVLVARESTERPEGIDAGTARLVGTDGKRILAELRTLLRDAEAYRQMATAVNPYGDGGAAGRTVTALTQFLGPVSASGGRVHEGGHIGAESC